MWSIPIGIKLPLSNNRKGYKINKYLPMAPKMPITDITITTMAQACSPVFLVHPSLLR